MNSSNTSAEWTSFRSLEPNPFPYTPMTQSIFHKSFQLSDLSDLVNNEEPLITFHRGYLLFNISEIKKFLDEFIDISPDILIEYLKDSSDIDLNQVSFHPKLSGVKKLPRILGIQIKSITNALLVKQRLPHQPEVSAQNTQQLIQHIEKNMTFLTNMVSSHIIISVLAEIFAVGVEKQVPKAPSRQNLQNYISKWTNSKTSQMAKTAANLHEGGDIDQFLDDYGHRCPREMEIAVPRWSEEPDSLLNGIGGSAPLDECSNDTGGLSSTLYRLLLLPGVILERLRENPKNEWLKSYTYLRNIMLEAGRQATNTGHLAKPSDIFFVDLDTCKRLVSEAPSRSFVRDTVLENRQDYTLHSDYRPPLLLTEEFSPIETDQNSSGRPNLHNGLGVSKGNVAGKAIVVSSPEEADLDDRQGPVILVTEFTDAGWTPLFFKIDGLVLERGSLLSHGSIVAREAGIPAVVNISNATEVIKSGNRLHIDGEEGTVIMDSQNV